MSSFPSVSETLCPPKMSFVFVSTFLFRELNIPDEGRYAYGVNGRVFKFGCFADFIRNLFVWMMKMPGKSDRFPRAPGYDETSNRAQYLQINITHTNNLFSFSFQESFQAQLRMGWKEGVAYTWLPAETRNRYL